MDNCIFINVNMFAKSSQVFIIYGSETNTLIGNYTIEELPKVVVNLAHSEHIYSVKISGASKFSQLIEFGIEQNEMTKYNENKIKVEVM